MTETELEKALETIVRKARERAEEMRKADGRKAGRTRGSMAEMMREAGFSVERVRRTGELTRSGGFREGMVALCGAERCETFSADFDRVVAEMSAPVRKVVRAGTARAKF